MFFYHVWGLRLTTNLTNFNHMFQNVSIVRFLIVRFLVAGFSSGAIPPQSPQSLKITRIQSPGSKPSTLSFSDPFGPPSEGGGPSTPQPAMTSEPLDHHHHLGGSQTPHDNSANSTPTNASKSAFIELQQHGYGPFKGGYQHPHHFGSPGGQQNPHEASGFPSPRSLGYPFPPMHQNTYGYHLGSYAPQCSSPPKDGKLLFNYLLFQFCS